jgi:hypothetical protein
MSNINAQLDEVLGRLGLMQARMVRIETRVSKIAIRLGLTHEGESIIVVDEAQPPPRRTAAPEVSVTP